MFVPKLSRPPRAAVRGDDPCRLVSLSSQEEALTGGVVREEGAVSFAVSWPSSESSTLARRAVLAEGATLLIL